MKVVLAYGITSPLSAIAPSHSFQSQAGPLVSVMQAGPQPARVVSVTAVAGAGHHHRRRLKEQHVPGTQRATAATYRRREVLYASKAALAQPHASGESASTITQTLGVSGATVYRVLAEDGKHEG
jgi:hypothetical protein